MTWVVENYLLNLPRGVLQTVPLVSLLAAVARLLWLRHRRVPGAFRLVALEAAMVAAVLVVLALTLHPREGGAGDRVRQLDPYITGRRTHVGHPELRQAESLANLAMLVPFGFLLGLRKPSLLRGGRALAVVVAVPLVPELLQYLLPLGRVAALEDVELGVCGTAFGLGLGGVIGALAQRRARRLTPWTCASCTAASATICLLDSCPTRRGSPSSVPSMPRSRREPAHRR